MNCQSHWCSCNAKIYRLFDVSFISFSVMNDSQDDLGLIGGTAEVVEDEDEVAELAEIS